MTILLLILDWTGRVTALLFLLALIGGLYAWIKGILPVLVRLGNGLAKKKIAIFAKGDHLGSLESLLLDSKLFSKKNITGIASESDFGRAERATLFLVYWHDWPDQITQILNAKKNGTALVVYAPHELGQIPRDKMDELNGKLNVMVANFRGRLLNDMLISLMTTSYQ
ncbi:MAG TPA: hypothetical protein VN729_05990 [Ktedonobacteraceae bacterium]|nr:hypothetical protein [Ktedonobacteraceae bacterium]